MLLKSKGIILLNGYRRGDHIKNSLKNSSPFYEHSLFFIEKEYITGDLIFIIGKDYDHLVKVLRGKIGDAVEISDNAAMQCKRDFKCKILKTVKISSIEPSIFIKKI